MRLSRRIAGLLGAGLLAALAGLVILQPAWPRASIGRADSINDNDSLSIDSRMVERAQSTEDLEAFANDHTGRTIPIHLRSRTALLEERARLHAASDATNLARLNSVLASEAFERAEQVTIRWLNHRDEATGLFPHTLRPSGRYFSYGDVGADLFPFLAIATRELVPHRYHEILSTLAAERGLREGFPWDLMIDTREPRPREREKQMLSNVEYAKDGLLPLIERAGPDPWLVRMREVLDAVLDHADVPTPLGPIPSHAAEVNGSLLQVLSRLAWTHAEPRDLEMGRRIAAAYLDHALTGTGWIPPEQWDFMAGRPIGPANLHLGDHGDEIISGLIEWHRIEVARGLPEQATHGEGISRMLDRLLENGRSRDGLWFDGIAYPSGRVVELDLNDNWGYLGQAYLNHAATLRSLDAHSHQAADRYEVATQDTLRAVAKLDFYRWERGNMDGYADTLESALYLLRHLDVPEAVDWVDRHMGVLYGFQRSDGTVTDENIDGNFIRTAMLYGLWLTQGARLDPWTPTVSLGAEPNGQCLEVHVHADEPWSGRLLFDTSRHAQHLGLTMDYPRLNQWPEWWTAIPGQTYAVTSPNGRTLDVSSEGLAAGLQLTILPAEATSLQICPR